MTDPATDADRAEQVAAVQPDGPGTHARTAPPADDVPVADAVEQQLTVVPSDGARPVSLPAEADEYDVLEQMAAVPLDDDDHRD
ncbi:hypothetical protein GB931_17135 [Modestobacter sp. I12A-02628]|uniref:Uncharacterized protein n=1 Tax=Goekera deserti TaxID=2497753 RepID=A0A7K3WE56_9ACTN|nr:hypothetical protein [Goekera deserti]MPQ99609.1 hypothetical protein [Goekera deserti]NDI46381.1 hypothetical protein [Goekera deserti]NEL54687.1 hypothetical protein [Goekera deserti]